MSGRAATVQQFRALAKEMEDETKTLTVEFHGQPLAISLKDAKAMRTNFYKWRSDYVSQEEMAEYAHLITAAASIQTDKKTSVVRLIFRGAVAAMTYKQRHTKISVTS